MSARILVLFFCLITPVRAGELGSLWSEEDKSLQRAYYFVLAIDWAQTRYIAKHPQDYHETNRLLGVHPSTREVDRYFLSVGLLQLGIAHVLPPGWRRVFQHFVISQHYTAAENNYQLGIGLDF